MKALILAAGEGTRLRPITNTIPKVLVPVGGRPLLGIHFEQLKAAGINDILINTYWLPEPVRDFVSKYQAPDFKVTLVHESKLLGSAGTFFNSRDFFGADDGGKEDFLILYCDNYTDISYEKLIKYHTDKKNLATIVCTGVENIEKKGMMVVDKDARIIDFKEKPAKEEVVSHYANSGIYIFNKKIFEVLKDFIENHNWNVSPIDFGKDVFPFMLKNNIPIHAYLFDGYLVDIGDHTAYAMVNAKLAKSSKLPKS